VSGGMPNGPVTGDTYVYNTADGSINSVPKRPAAATKLSTSSPALPVQEMIPSDWERQIAIARDAQGTAPGGAVTGTWTVTMRETGGFLNRWGFSMNWTAGSYVNYNGATYLDAKYAVTATYEGQTAIPVADPATGWKGGAVAPNNPKQDSAGAAFSSSNGKLTYGNMCKFSYRFTRIGNANTVTQGNVSDATAWDGTSAAKTDATGTCGIVGCTAWSTQGHGSSTAARITNSIGDSYGDWVGTFYTHDKLPRIAKDFRSAIGRSANADAWSPSIPSNAVPMGNWAFFDWHDGNTASTDTPNPAANTATTPSTQLDDLMTQTTRAVFP